jgi:hypothetical protein
MTNEKVLDLAKIGYHAFHSILYDKFFLVI